MDQKTLNSIVYRILDSVAIHERYFYSSDVVTNDDITEYVASLENALSAMKALLPTKADELETVE